MIDIQVMTKNEYYDHIGSIYCILKPEDVVISRLFMLIFTYIVYVAVVIFIDYSDMDI